jgi:hypothetical protein
MQSTVACDGQEIGSAQNEARFRLGLPRIETTNRLEEVRIVPSYQGELVDVGNRGKVCIHDTDGAAGEFASRQKRAARIRDGCIDAQDAALEAKGQFMIQPPAVSAAYRLRVARSRSAARLG